jgi:glycosyltransferase involved in cell wall biosynthesis
MDPAGSENRMSAFLGKIDKSLHWLSLAATAHADSRGIKLLSKPGYRGGPGTKSAQLGALLAGRFDPFGILIALSAAAAPLALVRYLKARGVRLLVNQNGVYYPSWAGETYAAKNAYLKQLNDLADHTFFQSHFAQESYEKWVGQSPKNSSILHNPVETTLFHPVERASDSFTILHFCDFREAYRPYWDYFFGWLGKNPSIPGDARVLAVGNVGEGGQAILNELRDRTWGRLVEFHSNVEREALPGLLARADLMVHLIYNDVCPNKVLEAMACGVWPVCVSAGGSKELVGDAGAVLCVEAGYEAPKLPEVSLLNDAVKAFLIAPGALKAAARARAEQFDVASWRSEVLSVARSLS